MTSSIRPNAAAPVRRHAHPRVLAALLAGAVSTLALAGITAQASVAAPHAAAKNAHGGRVGGTVRHAWPKTGKAPRAAQVRWLARQVGTIKPRACAKQWRHANRRCHVRRLSAHAAQMGVLAGDPGSRPGSVARIAAAAVPTGARTAVAGSIALPLQLVRSYEIPVNDPSYNRLLGWSWTYDSAVSAAAFAASGDQANSAQLLDQLAALQHTDGSLEIAFDTTTGEGAGTFRAGTVAWLGLAAATYDQASGTSRYLDTQRRTADYLISLQTPGGLVKGGPDVSWVSTQHNLITYAFLTRLANELQGTGDTAGVVRYRAVASTIAAAINATLVVSDAAGVHFRRGLGDDTQAVDVQALGAMFLQGTGQPALAGKVLDYAEATFAVRGRAVVRSSDPATYNMTYSAPGPFTGYVPQVGGAVPDVRWAEASAEMRLATAALGRDTTALDASIAGWAAITPGSGALQSDATVTGAAGETEFHVWPASTATAWTVLAKSTPAFFAAPLPPAVALVTDWTKVRGANLITTAADGSVAMTTGAGERRVLSGATTGTDYTVTSTATLLSGAGYAVYVRASVDAATKMTGLYVQFDHAYGAGQLLVREIDGDVEVNRLLNVPLPAGFVWYGVPHVLVVTVKGNTMTASVDGVQLVNILDLNALSVASERYTFGAATTVTPPVAGGYGLRSWGDGLVNLHQMTVGAAR